MTIWFEFKDPNSKPIFVNMLLIVYIEPDITGLGCYLRMQDGNKLQVLDHYADVHARLKAAVS